MLYLYKWRTDASSKRISTPINRALRQSLSHASEFWKGWIQTSCELKRTEVCGFEKKVFVLGCNAQYIFHFFLTSNSMQAGQNCGNTHFHKLILAQNMWLRVHSEFGSHNMGHPKNMPKPTARPLGETNNSSMQLMLWKSANSNSWPCTSTFAIESDDKYYHAHC